MREVFADTFYWVALTHPPEQFHQEALALDRELRSSARVVTTQEVLVEYLNLFSTLGSYWRDRASAVADALRRRNGVEVILQSKESFDSGFDLYRERRDKAYSLTDCISMQLMRRRGIREALTYDHHFEQEGFQALFR